MADRGLLVTGVDSSPTMISLCRTRLPDHEWIVADMRKLALGRRFDGILAWDHSMPPALRFRRGRYGIGAAKSVSGHTVEPPEAGDARRKATRRAG